MSLPFYDGQVVTAADLNSLVPSPTLASPAGASLIGYGATTVDAALSALAPPPVFSVAGKTGVVTLTVSDITGAAALAGNAGLNFSVATATGPTHAIPLAQADLRYAPFGGGGGGGGGVSSVGLSLPPDFTVTGSPVTASGVLTATRAPQAQKLFLASPSASSGAPVYRLIASTDIPTLNQNTTGSAASLSATLPVNKGGTGAITEQGALNALTNVAAATNGYVLTKDSTTGNVIFKAPSGGSGAMKKIVVLGDSLSYPGAERRVHWPDLLQQSMTSMGIDVNVINCAVSGHSFYKVNNTTSFGSNTALQQCIAAAPDLILVMLGANDALIQVDGRNLAQVKSDASTTLSALRAALPSAKILYISELCYDSANFSASSTKNKGVVPAFFSLPTTGILAGSFCTEALNLYLDGGQQGAFTNWSNFDVYLKGLGFDGYFTMNLFQITRLGCTMPDGLHPSTEGTLIMHAQILNGMALNGSVLSLFPKVSEFAYNITSGAQFIFNTLLTASGDGYVSNVSPSNINGEKLALENGFERVLDPDSWFFPYKTSLWASPLSGSISAKTPILFVMQNAPPNTQVYHSVNGGSFNPLTVSTDAKGNLWFPNDYASFGGTPGAFSLRYRVGNTCSGAFSITITA